MVQVNIAEAKTHLSRLVQKALNGEEVIIARDNKAVVRLVPVDPPKQKREPGTARGRVWAAADFDQTPSDLDDYV